MSDTAPPVYMALVARLCGSDVTSVSFVRDRMIVPRSEVATCAACGKSICDHSDLVFVGLAPVQSKGGAA